MVLDSKEAVDLENLRKKANTFTNKLMKTPLPQGVDTSKGLLEALFQTMKNNPLMLEEFQRILKKTQE